MTRKEAIEKVQADDNDRFSRDRWLIESLVKLGMLKLDEPKNAQFKFLSDIAVLLSANAAAIVNDTLAQNGLKIVEK